jgi:hypothetical protein
VVRIPDERGKELRLADKHEGRGRYNKLRGLKNLPA